MDELEYAADMRLRRDLRQRAPLQRLRPDAVAQPDRVVAVAPHHRHRDLRHGQLARALQPADPRRRRVRDDRLHLRRPADRRLPGRHADGRLLRLRPEPEPAARPLLRGARPGDEGLAHPTRSRSTAATTSSATSTSGRARSSSRTRRYGSPAAARSRPGNGAPRWTTSTRICLTSATRSAGHDGRLLGGDGPARQGPQSVSRRLRCSPWRGRNAQQAIDLYTEAGRVLLRPLPARRSALRRPARLLHRGDDALRPHQPGQRRGRASRRGRPR